ncbi:MAG: hypothetical protein JW819_09205 [Candidatus Krumholzibacteriota bacterium]|nr:hypothetical protein [Candidatus Krumholzibacteriota bacterium]
MECYKEFPRRVGMLTSLAGTAYAMAGVALTLAISPWLAAGFVVLLLFVQLFHYPRSACVNCYYFDRTCVSFKGKLAARLYRRGEEATFPRGMRRAMLGVWAIWAYPLAVLAVAQVLGRDIYFSDLLLAAVLVVLMVMRQMMRPSLGCRVCMMREDCPNVGPDRRRPVEVTDRAPARPGG